MGKIEGPAPKRYFYGGRQQRQRQESNLDKELFAERDAIIFDFLMTQKQKEAEAHEAEMARRERQSITAKKMAPIRARKAAMRKEKAERIEQGRRNFQGAKYRVHGQKIKKFLV